MKKRNSRRTGFRRSVQSAGCETRPRECNVYCEIYSYKTDLEKIKAMNPKGIILTGGPNSCYEADSPTCQIKNYSSLVFRCLGLCYGAQLMMHVLGGKVEKADVSEYGKTEVLVDKQIPKSSKTYLIKQSAG